ncbi:ABC transporter permease [Patulibacter sp.]|uniref:ABC transporter permease n=1 Tax=Patulibacter sp. TaxID=1912859 RepID=UPI002721F41C|nr:ABC transporter permease [Patulibacter sp.]MDO9409889.1 ABC transporter permease [Patulibacter sp.]
MSAGPETPPGSGSDRDGGAAAGAVVPATAGPRRRLGRLERLAIEGVMTREVINWLSFWKSSTFSSTVEPTIYLLAFGFGFGSIVSEIDGYDYVDYVGTGTVATSVLFGSAFSAMFGSFVKREFQRTYDAILAAPVDVEELVTAEALWMAIRASVYGCFPLLVAMIFGLDPAWGMLLVPLLCFPCAFGFASFGLLISAIVRSIDSFSYYQSLILTPLFLVAGTFFPLDGLPRGIQIASELNPLHHLVELVRGAAFGFDGWHDVARFAALIVFALVMWRLAIRQSTKRLIT